jgi:hypothetical protein
MYITISLSGKILQIMVLKGINTRRTHLVKAAITPDHNLIQVITQIKSQDLTKPSIDELLQVLDRTLA